MGNDPVTILRFQNTGLLTAACRAAGIAKDLFMCMGANRLGWHGLKLVYLHSAKKIEEG